MIRAAAVSIIALALTGCAGFDTDTKQIQAACVGITTATKAIIIHRDALTPSDERLVVQALDAAAPVCGQGDAPTKGTVALAVVRQAQATLDAIMERLQ